MKRISSGIHAKPWYLSRTLHWVGSSWLVTIGLCITDIVENGGVIDAKIVSYFFLETAMLYQAAVSTLLEVDVLISRRGYSRNEAEQIIKGEGESK